MVGQASIKKTFWSALLLLLAFTVTATAQNIIRVEVRPDALVSQDENFQVIFTIEGSGTVRDFQWDPGEDFHLVWGPARSSSTSTTIINGKRETTSRQSYSYTLKALRTGKLPIAQASANIDGTQVFSEIGSVTVIEGEQRSAAEPGAEAESAAPGSAPGRSQAASEAREDLFIRMIPSKRRVVVGEAFRFEIKVYTKVDLNGFDGAKLPSFDNFSKQEDSSGSDIQFHREEYGGTIYYAATIASYTLTPLKAGTIPIEPAELSCIYSVRNASTGDPFEDFFGTGTRQIRKTLRAPGLDITVNPLPAGAPASFNGAVGTFSMNASMSATNMQENQAGSLTVRLTGTGNIAMVKAPAVSFPQDFETYGIETSFAASGRLSGTQTFEYPFIPRTDGHFTIGPVEFTYYNTDTRRYETLKAGPFDLSVTEDPDAAVLAPAGGSGSLPQIAGTRVESKGESIHYIRTRTSGALDERKRSFWVSSPLYWGILALLLLFLPVYLPLSGAINRRRADVVGAKNRRAGKLARARLRTSASFLKKDLYSAFYEELHRALLGYISDKLLLSVADLSRERVRPALLEGGVPEKTVDDFEALLDACEYARYAPQSDHGGMQEHYDSAVRVLSDIDATMKKGTKSSARGSVRASFLLALMLLPSGTMLAQEPAADTLGTPSVPSSAEALWQAGAAAYADGRYSEAYDSWNALVADYGVRENADLWYNLGNAAFQKGDAAHAVLGYERALRLNPSYSDARYNLDLLRDRLDKIDAVPEFALKRFFRSIGQGLGANAWAFIAALLFAAAVLGALAFLRSARRGLRMTGFYGGILCLLLSVTALGFSLWQHADYSARDAAVVMKARSSVRSAPSENGSTSLFDLHAGTKVTTLETLGDWTNIRIADGREGWIRTSEIEII